MSRVEWTRRAPEEVESVLGIMLLREFPNGQRIRPARGDNGIDVFVPFPDGWVVYQVKSFTTALTSSHKRQITKSWSRFQDFITANDVNVKAWYLVRPLNPTQPEIDWLATLTEGATFPCEWRGLDFCEGLIAKYPEVADYYLFDGKDRLQEVVRTLLNATGGSGGTESEPFRPSDAYPTLESLHEALNAFDPHYRFDFAVATVRDGEEPARPAATPDLVAATISVSRGRAVTFLIFARFREATIERPVPGSFTPKLEPGSAAARAWEEFLTYGIPVQELAVSQLLIDLPGGLGTEATDAFVNVGPASLETAQPFDLTVEVLDQAGGVLAATDVYMAPATVGISGTGIATSGTEAAGVFNLALRFRLDQGGLKFHITGNDLTGQRPAAVLPGLDVLIAFEPGRKVRLRLKDGPQLAEPETIPEGLPGRAQSQRIRRICDALALLQLHTLKHVLIPDLTVTTNDQARAWVDAAQLLRGETLTMRWNEAVLEMNPEQLPAVGHTADFITKEPIQVTVNDFEIEVGRKVTTVHARVTSVEPTSGDVTIEPGDHDTLEVRLDEDPP